MTKKISQKGFTLVELAIALMVIGLLIGGVLKGQELIENARATAVVRQIKAYDTATMIFRSTYNAFPGDIRNPGTRIPNCTAGVCVASGNQNGLIRGAGDNEDEYWNYFVHMTKAGMIQGPEGGVDGDKATAPEKFLATSSGYDGVMIGMEHVSDGTHVAGLAGDVPVPAGHFYLLYNMPLKGATQVDAKLDDGTPCLGDVFPKHSATCGSLSANTYMVMQSEAGITHDLLIIRAQF